MYVCMYVAGVLPGADVIFFLLHKEKGYGITICSYEADVRRQMKYILE